MYSFIFLLGSQGSGKTTIASLLKEKLGSPHIDYDWIRGFHLNKDWSNTSDKESEIGPLRGLRARGFFTLVPSHNVCPGP